MEKRVKNFEWVIENPTSFFPNNFCEIQFSIDGCRWKLIAVLVSNGNKLEFYYQYEGVADGQSLPCRWRRHIKFSLKIVNRLSKHLSIVTDSERYFDEKYPTCCNPTLLSPSIHLAKYRGFCKNNGEIKIVVEIVAHEVTGTIGELVDSNNDLLNKTRQISEWIDFNGFQVLPSKVESMKRILEKYPDFASKLCSKNQPLKSTYMNVVLEVIETLCKSPQKLTDGDLADASNAASFIANGGFKINWLKKMIKEVKAKKKKVDSRKARLRQRKKELQKYNNKCSDLQALLEKEETNLWDASVPLSFDDVLWFLESFH